MSYMIERRSPASLRLEVAMMNALVAAKWDPKEIAGWIAAQRRDGLLSLTTPPWLVNAQLEEWQRMTPPRIRVECKKDEAELTITQHTHTDTL